jgi:glycosyltransferase involved in cell wall biosynthesis
MTTRPLPAGSSLHHGRPRILFVDQTAQLGGAELCLLDLVQARRGEDRVILLQPGPLETKLREAGCDVSVLELSGSANAIRKESGLIDKLWASTHVYQLGKRLATSAGDQDLLYANTPKALIIAAIAAKLARKPLVYHLHDILSPEHFSQSNLWMLTFLSNRMVSHVIANSEASKQAYRKAGGRAPVSVIYNGFHAAPYDAWYAARQQHRAAIRTELGLGEQPTVAVFGRLAPWKGQHLAIEALRNLPGVQLLLVGDALFGEEEYKRSLIQLASQPEVAGRVRFLGFRHDVGPLMQAVDGVVHCSTAPEPFGRVIVEAMLSRQPIIASRAGGALEIIEDGKTGTLVPPEDVNALADAMRRMLDRANASMIDRAYATAVEKFALDRVVQQIEGVLQSVVASR